MATAADVHERPLSPRATALPRAGLGVSRLVLGGVVAVAALVACAILLVGEARYRSCIAAAEVRYPAVAVSALNSRTTGPLKVSFVNERARAIDACGRV